jgi:hypothetical protein
MHSWSRLIRDDYPWASRHVVERFVSTVANPSQSGDDLDDLRGWRRAWRPIRSSDPGGAPRVNGPQGRIAQAMNAVGRWRTFERSFL